MSACAADACPDFVGDPALPVELEVRVLDGDGRALPGADGMRVPLLQPPQGGKVIYAGARARNLALCGAQILASLRDGDEAGARIVGLEGRPLRLVDGGDGWAYAAEPMQASSYANLPLCPNHVSTRDIPENPYRLTVTLEDSEGREGSASLAVVPYCAEPEHAVECACTCAEDYVLGRPCT